MHIVRGRSQTTLTRQGKVEDTENVNVGIQISSYNSTVRPRDKAARTSQVHVFELGPKIFEMHGFAHFCTFLQVFLINEYLRCTFFDE